MGHHLSGLGYVFSSVDNCDLATIGGNIKAPFAGPETPFLIRPNFPKVAPVSKVINLVAAEKINLELLFAKGQPSAVATGNTDRGPIGPKTLAWLVASARGFIRLGDADIAQPAVRQLKAFIIEHFAAVIGRPLAIGEFTGKPESGPFITIDRKAVCGGRAVGSGAAGCRRCLRRRR